jgi:hypothetical protein
MKRPSTRSMLLMLCALAMIKLAYANDSTLVDHHPAKAMVAEGLRKNFQELIIPSARFISSDPITAIQETAADTVLDKRRHAHALLERVVAGQRFLETLDALTEIELPVGVVKSGGAMDYTILIDRIAFTREGATMDVYVSMALPQTGTRIAFHGQVPLSADGGVAGSAKVYLLGDHVIRLNHSSVATIKGDERSYVEFDCGGFLGVNIEAEIEFSSDLVIPEDENGHLTDKRLKVAFSTYTQSLNDILVQVTLPPFQLKSLNGFGFHVTKAFLDWSDLSNPPNLEFPVD